MNCPKCGKELLNVNGKYICVDCGIEVPESGTAGSQIAEQPTPASLTGNEQAKQVEKRPETTGQPAEETPPAEPQPTEPMASVEKAPDQAADSSQSGPSSVDSSVPIADLQAGEKEEPNQEKPLAEQPRPEALTQSEETEVPASKDESNLAVEPVPVSIEVKPASETVQLEQQESEPVQEETSQNQEAGIPEVKSEPEPPDPFEAAEQSSPTPFQPETAPVDAIRETTPTPDQPSPVQADPTIFQDPMYDMKDTTARQPLDQSAPAASLQDGTKKLKIIVIAGIAVAVILAIGGIIAYLLLT
jgi:hypothetical protein